MTKVDKIMAQVAILIDVEKGNGNEFHTTYDKLRAMIEAAVKVPDGWQPIESAPKDGMIVLLRGKRAIADGFFNGKAWIWPYINAEPTHWMPLPAAPKQEEV